MYEITCTECGRVGFHPSRTAAESKAERHQRETAHAVTVATMDEV